VREIVREAGRNNDTFASLVMGVVKSTPFQMREALGPHAAEQAAR